MQINNLARDNMHDKLHILSDLVTDEFWPWFGNYMVVKRAAQVWPLQLLVNAHLPYNFKWSAMTTCFYFVPLTSRSPQSMHKLSCFLSALDVVCVLFAGCICCLCLCMCVHHMVC